MRHAVKFMSVSALVLSALSFATLVRSAEPHYVLPPQAVMADPRFVPPQAIIQCAATDDACACPQTAAVPSSAGPMIISYGPPPSAYSPSADFRARLQTTPGWASYVDSCIAASAAAASAYPPPPPLPYPMYSPGYGPSPAQVSAMELPPPPGFEVCQPRQFAVEERFAYRDAPAYPRQPERSRTVAWSAPLCNCPSGAATCNAGCSFDGKATANTAFSTACGHDCPCGATCQCGTACDCAANCTCGTNATKACAANCSTCSSQCSTECACGTAGRLEHILEAAHHLEAAGMQADADALRVKCDSEMKAVLQRLKKAEAEVARLQTAAMQTSANEHCTTSDCQSCTTECKAASPACDKEKMVTIDIQCLEVDRSQARNAGFDFTSWDASECQSEAFLRSLRQAGCVSVISKPRLMTLSGRPAQISVGRDIVSEDQKSEFEGIKVDVVPLLLDSNNLRLDLRACFANCGCTTQIDTAMTVGSGDCRILGGAVGRDVKTDVIGDDGETRQREHEVQRLVLVRPTILNQTDAEQIQACHSIKDEMPEVSRLSIDLTSFVDYATCSPKSCDDGPCDFANCRTCRSCIVSGLTTQSIWHDSKMCDYLYFGSRQLSEIVPPSAVCNPFESTTIELPAFQFELPETIPAEKQIESDFQAEAAPREFIPHMAKPLWLARPVVAPVNYEEPVRE